MRKLLSAFLFFLLYKLPIAQILSPTIVKHKGVHYDQYLARIDTILKQYVDKNFHWLALFVIYH